MVKSFPIDYIIFQIFLPLLLLLYDADSDSLPLLFHISFLFTSISACYMTSSFSFSFSFSFSWSCSLFFLFYEFISYQVIQKDRIIEFLNINNREIIQGFASSEIHSNRVKRNKLDDLEKFIRDRESGQIKVPFDK